MRELIGGLVLVTACSSAPMPGGGDSVAVDSGAPAEDAPSDLDAARCDPADRSGTYDAVFLMRQGGTCGAVPEQLVIVGPDAPDAGCVIDSALVSADQCSQTVAETCGPLKITVFSTDKNGDGSVLVAEETVTSTAPACTSTYDVTLTRK